MLLVYPVFFFFYSETLEKFVRQIIKLLGSNVEMWSGEKLISFH